MRQLFVSFVLLLVATSSFASDMGARAAEALFVKSDSSAARQLAREALNNDGQDVEASFVAMEAASLQADDAGVIDAALTLINAVPPDDPRAAIAIARLRSLAANSRTFKARLPQLRSAAQLAPEVTLALVSAASDGAPELNLLEQSRDAGLVTDWKVVGPFGKYALAEFDRSFAPERDQMRQMRYERRTVERVRFADGQFKLPEHYRKEGVFYAVGEVFLLNDGDWTLFLETPGLTEVRIDGESVLVRDDRLGTQPQTLRKTLRMLKGEHRVLVKFAASASPFRLAVMPPSGGRKRKNNIPLLKATPESEYVQAAIEYWNGDAAKAIQKANALSIKSPPAVARLLLSEAWDKSSGDAPEIRSELEAAIALDPKATEVAIKLADLHFKAGRTDQGLRLLKSAGKQQPTSERWLRLAVREFERLDWAQETTRAYKSLLAEHASCELLQQASGYFAAKSEFQKASAFEKKLANCAPGSLVYAQSLSAKGNHQLAAQAAATVVAQNPLDRTSREFQVRELLLASDPAAARAAHELLDLSPDNSTFAQLADAAEEHTLPEEPKSSLPVDYFAPYRRDGLAVVQQTRERKFSGVPAVLLLNDRAVIDRDGHRYVYSHKITRIFNREGLIAFGEVAIPDGAELLQLRTIKSTGEIFEPELTDHKATISMPALAPEDSIEEEYISSENSSEPLRFELGSFTAPIVLSRLTVIGAPELEIRSQHEAPQPTVTRRPDGLRAHTWERNDIPQSVREKSSPQAAVIIAGDWSSAEELKAKATDEILQATREGPRVQALVASLKQNDEMETARALYNAVAKQINTDESTVTTGLTSAEESLQSGVGSRAATLLAAARAAGLRSELRLARPINSDDSLENYTRPLLAFHIADRTVLADVESEGLAFGRVSVELADPTIPVAEFAGMSLSRNAPLMSSLQSTASHDIR